VESSEEIEDEAKEYDASLASHLMPGGDIAGNLMEQILVRS
jgi:hypothetical protein